MDLSFLPMSEAAEYLKLFYIHLLKHSISDQDAKNKIRNVKR